MKLQRFFLPINLDVNAIRDEFRAEYAEKLLFFISTVHFCRVTNRKFKDEDGFIPLKAEILGRFIRPNDVRRVKEDLIRLGVIETDGIYRKGKKCFGFRLADKYRHEKFVSVPAQFPKEKECMSKKQKMSDAEEYIYDTLQRATVAPEGLKEIEIEYSEAVEKYNYALISYYMIEDGNFFFSRDDKTGRVFHNVANCPKILRSHLKLDGQSLVESDISNSQPLLLYCLYPDKQSAEALSFKEIVETGQFYEVIQNETGQDRETTKNLFMSFAFGELKYQNKVSKAFKALFPELAGVIENLKARDYTALALALQKFEADLVVKTVVPMLRMRRIPCLTVHDSIMTLPEYSEEVCKLIREQCQRLYDVVPTVRAKERDCRGEMQNAC